MRYYRNLNDIKVKNPACDFVKRERSGEFETISDEEYEKMLKKVERMAELFEDKPEMPMLDLYKSAVLYMINRDNLSGKEAEKVAHTVFSDLFNKFYVNILYGFGLSRFVDEIPAFDIFDYVFGEKQDELDISDDDFGDYEDEDCEVEDESSFTAV